MQQMLVLNCAYPASWPSRSSRRGHPRLLGGEVIIRGYFALKLADAWKRSTRRRQCTAGSIGRKCATFFATSGERIEFTSGCEVVRFSQETSVARSRQLRAAKNLPAYVARRAERRARSSPVSRGADLCVRDRTAHRCSGASESEASIGQHPSGRATLHSPRLRERCREDSRSAAKTRRVPF